MSVLLVDTNIVSYLMCTSFLSSRRHQPIQIQGRTTKGQIEQDGDRMGQDFADEPMLIVPQITHADARHRKAFRQLRTDRVDPLPPARTGRPHLGTMGTAPAVARRCNDDDPVPFGEQGVADGINEACVGGHNTDHALHQIIQ